MGYVEDYWSSLSDEEKKKRGWFSSDTEPTSTAPKASKEAAQANKTQAVEPEPITAQSNLLEDSGYFENKDTPEPEDEEIKKPDSNILGGIVQGLKGATQTVKNFVLGEDRQQLNTDKTKAADFKKPEDVKLSDDEYNSRVLFVQGRLQGVEKQLAELRSQRTTIQGQDSRLTQPGKVTPYQGDKEKRLSPVQETIDRLSVAETYYRQFLGYEPIERGAIKALWSQAKNPQEFIPFFEALEGRKDKGQTADALVKYDKGEELDPEEQAQLEKFQAEAFNQLIDKGMGYQTGDAIMQTAKIAIQFAMSGGVAGGAKVAAETATINAVSRTAMPEVAQSLLSKSVGIAASGAVRTGTVGLPQIANGTAEFMLPKADVLAGKPGDSLLDHLDKGDSFQKALGKSVLREYISNASEDMGVFVEDGGKFMQKAILNKLAMKRGLDTVESLTKFSEKIGWNGILGEVFEEEIGEAATAPIESREYFAPLLTPQGTERLLVESLAIGSFQGIAKAGDYIESRKSGTRNTKQKVVDIPVKDATGEDTKNASIGESVSTIPSVISDELTNRSEARTQEDLVKRQATLSQAQTILDSGNDTNIISKATELGLTPTTDNPADSVKEATTYLQSYIAQSQAEDSANTTENAAIGSDMNVPTKTDIVPATAEVVPDAQITTPARSVDVQGTTFEVPENTPEDASLIYHGGKRAFSQVQEEGVKTGENGLAGKGIYFTDSVDTASTFEGATEGANSNYAVDVSQFNLLTIPSDPDTFAKENGGSSAKDVPAIVAKMDGDYDGFIITNPDPQIGNTYVVTNTEKLDIINRGNKSVTAPATTTTQTTEPKVTKTKAKAKSVTADIASMTTTELSKEAKNSLENDQTGIKKDRVKLQSDLAKGGVERTIEVRRLEDGSLSIVDGRHALEAARSEGREVKIKDVTAQYAAPEKNTKSAQTTAVTKVVEDEAKSIKQIAEETGIKEPNVRRILGVGAKEGTFERIDKGVYVLNTNGQDIAYIETGSAVDVLPRLAKEGFKADMIFLDIPYKTNAVTGGNRGIKYDVITPAEFKTVLAAIKTIARDENTPVFHMYSQATSGLKQMGEYNKLFADTFMPVARGEYTKTQKDGVTQVRNMRGDVIKPEGLIVGSVSGKLNFDNPQLNFKLIRPKGYQTEKPAEMLSALIKMSTRTGDTVLDPFSGSGVTGAEAIRLNRKTYNIEANTAVVQNFTTPRIKQAADETAPVATANLSTEDKTFIQELEESAEGLINERINQLTGEGNQGVSYGFVQFDDDNNFVQRVGRQSRNPYWYRAALEDLGKKKLSKTDLRNIAIDHLINGYYDFPVDLGMKLEQMRKAEADKVQDFYVEPNSEYIGMTQLRASILADVPVTVITPVIKDKPQRAKTGYAERTSYASQKRDNIGRFANKPYERLVRIGDDFFPESKTSFTRAELGLPDKKFDTDQVGMPTADSFHRVGDNFYPTTKTSFTRAELGLDEPTVTKTTPKKRTTSLADKSEYPNSPTTTAPIAVAPSQYKQIEFPEMVAIAVELSGQVPAIKKKLGDARGSFHPISQMIKLRADIFSDPVAAAKTLAHEIGHLVDFLPDHNIKRGTLVKRLKSLSKDIKDATAGKPKNTVVMQELKKLTQIWKPFDETVDPAFTKYRYSSVELYADAISVLMNDPDLLKQQAPVFWATFFDHMDKKPEVKQNFLATWDLLNLGEEAVFSKRDEAISGMFKSGEDIFRTKLKEKQQRENNFMFKLRYEVVDKNAAVIDKVNQAKKEGKPVNDDMNPVYQLEQYNYVGGKIKQFVEANIQSVYIEIQKAGVGWDEFGKILFLERSANERGELANPLGFNPKTATDQIEGYKKLWGAEKWEVIERNLKVFRDAQKLVLDMALDSGLYRPELVKEMKANETYATYQVLDYMDLNISSSIKQQVGTLKEISNPATATIVKTLSIMRAVERNNTKKSITTFLTDNFKEDIKPAKTAFNGRIAEPIESRERDEALFTVMEGGQLKGFYVDPYIAGTMEHLDAGTGNAVLGALKFMNSKSFRPLFITFNLGFQSFNGVRDMMRFYKNTPGMNLWRVPVRYAQAIPAARARAFGLKNDLISEMEGKQILSMTYNDLIKGESEADQQIQYVMERAGINVEGNAKPATWKKVLQPARAVLQFIEDTGNFVESLPKVAGYIELNGKLPDKELASYIRTSIGSPDFLRKGAGYAWYNEVFLFSNAIKEGMRSDYNVAFTNPKTRSGYWFKSALMTFLPKMVMMGAAYGLFGELIKSIFDDASEYDKTNYTILPLGKDGDKSVYMRVPQDETGRLIGAIFWKAMRIASDQKMDFSDVTDLTAFASGQIPGFSPAIGVLEANRQFWGGNNPYDDFRGRNVIPDDEFAAGGLDALKPFVLWQFQQLGGSVFMGSSITEASPTTKSFGQKVLEFPVISNIAGRWIKTTNYGQREANREVLGDIRQQDAKARLETNEVLKDYVDQYNSGAQSTTRRRNLEEQLVREVYGKNIDDDDKTKAKNLQKKFRLTLVKGEADPLVNSFIDAQTNDQKVAVMKQIKERSDAAEYRALKRKLDEESLISKDLRKKLDKEKL